MSEREYVTSIVCKCSGEVVQSTTPHLHQQYRRRRGNERHDQPGGGAELKCFYIVYIKRQHFEAAMHILEECLPLVELYSILCQLFYIKRNVHQDLNRNNTQPGWNEDSNENVK